MVNPSLAVLGNDPMRGALMAFRSVGQVIPHHHLTPICIFENTSSMGWGISCRVEGASTCGQTFQTSDFLWLVEGDIVHVHAVEGLNKMASSWDRKSTKGPSSTWKGSEAPQRRLPTEIFSPLARGRVTVAHLPMVSSTSPSDVKVKARSKINGMLARTADYFSQIVVMYNGLLLRI